MGRIEHSWQRVPNLLILWRSSQYCISPLSQIFLFLLPCCFCWMSFNYIHIFFFGWILFFKCILSFQRILLNNITDLNLSCFGTPVPVATCVLSNTAGTSVPAAPCVLATGHQIYWRFDMDCMDFTSSVIWFHTQKNTHRTIDWHTRKNIY